MRLFLFVLCTSASTAFALDSATHQTTTLPSDARYEIVQSPLATKWTFRLDRYTGRVYQLVKTKNDNLAWEAMLIEGHYDVPKPDRPRFAIFSSGLAARHTFLMDSDTGQTWVLGTTLGATMWLKFKY
jgi:hypothetical protein